MTRLLGRYNEPWPHAETGPFRLRATVHLIDGRPEVTTIALGPLNSKDPTAIRTTPDIRGIALGPIVESVVSRSPLRRERRAARMLTNDPTLPTRQGAPQPDWAKAPRVQAAARRVLAETELLDEKRTGRPPLYDRAHFEQVAEVYIDALEDGKEPRMAVSDHFKVSPSNAAKWIHRCRQAPLNLLPPTSRGRSAGGATSTPKRGGK
jgi:hypothetical protein